MIIFHQFPSTETAEAFVIAVREQFALEGSVHATQDEANIIDPFPFQLIPPIVLIERADDIDDENDLEREVEAAVAAFGGEFAGT